MSGTKAAGQEKSPTKLTTKEYNELLQKWLMDEEKKKKDLGKKEIGLVFDEIVRINQRIEALRKAIALRFDPDEFERTLNVPLAAHIIKDHDNSRRIAFIGVARRITELLREAVDTKTMFRFEPVSFPKLGAILELDISNNVAPQTAGHIRVIGIERIRCCWHGLPYVEFIKGNRTIAVYCNGKVNDIEIP